MGEEVFFVSAQALLRNASPPPYAVSGFEGMHVKTDESRRGSCFAGLRPGAQAEGKARETANGRKAACLKSYRALRLKPVRILDFRWYRESPHPGEGLLFRKEAKARAVLGLAEPVHPLPHLPRQSRLFGRHFRLHPPGGRRSILLECRAARSNPALALRMRAMRKRKRYDWHYRPRLILCCANDFGTMLPLFEIVQKH